MDAKWKLIAKKNAKRKIIAIKIAKPKLVKSNNQWNNGTQSATQLVLAVMKNAPQVSQSLTNYTRKFFSGRPQQDQI